MTAQPPTMLCKSFVFVLLVLSAKQTLGQSVLTPCPEPPYNNKIAETIYNKLDSLRSFMLNGVPSLGIPVLDPFGPLPTLNFSINNSYLRLNGNISDTYIRNLAEYIVCQVTVEVGIKQKFYLDLRLDDFHIDGNYYVNGLYALLFPIFGQGPYTLDVYNASFTIGADLSYNVITNILQIHNLALDIVFDDLQIYMECLLGCGEMADFINAIISDFAEAAFNAIWDYIDPILTAALETAINNILGGIKIPPESFNGELARSDTVRMKLPLQKLLKGKGFN